MRDGAWQQFLILAVFAAFALLDVLLRWLRRPRQGAEPRPEPLARRDGRPQPAESATRVAAAPPRAPTRPEPVVLRASPRASPRATVRTPGVDRMSPLVSRRARRPMLDTAAARQGIVTMIILGPCRALE